MSLSAISAFLPRLKPKIAGLSNRDLLTIVLAGGCNLKCSWCAVNARQERQDGPPTFSEVDYCNLITGLATKKLISGVAIVGDEPLLDEAWPVARNILSFTSRYCHLPSALVTNGTKLAERSNELFHCESDIIVSLDGTSVYHDKTRRVKGAYEALIQGLKVTTERRALRDRITIASVVQPDKYKYLFDVPEVIARYKIKRWALSPLIQFRRTKPARLHPRLFPEIYDELPRLIDRGRAAGVRTMIDDSLQMLLQCDSKDKLAKRPIKRPATPDIKVLRMRPDGLTVRYTDLLDTDTSRGLRWDGVEPPAEFYRRLYARNPDPDPIAA